MTTHPGLSTTTSECAPAISAPRTRRTAGPLTAAVAALALACSPFPAHAQPLRPEDAKKPDPVPARADQPAPSVSIAAAEPFESRPVREIRIIGLKSTPAELVNNQVRSRAQAPLSTGTVRDDVQRLNRLGRFKEIRVDVQPYDDGSVALIYNLGETPIIKDVEVVGNRQLSNADLSTVINLLKDTPVDEFQIGAAKSNIERLYREKGYYQATVAIDQKELDEHGILLFRVTESDRVKVTDIRFDGNKSFPPRQLFPAIKSRTAGLFESGPLDNETLDRDVAELVSFYKDRGYLDVRADRQVVFAPNGKEAIVTFLIEEGRVYTLRSVKTALANESGQPLKAKPPARPREPSVFSQAQVAGLMAIKAGDVYSADKIRKSIDEVQNAYARIGYCDARVSRAELRDETIPEVDLLVLVREGEPYLTGLITLSGNELTQKKVPLRELDTLRPDRPLDTSRRRVGDRAVLESEDRLRNTRLFDTTGVKVTVQPPDARNPDHRDVLVEVRETNTGSLGFGAGITSDAGVIGSIHLSQRNFDWQDVPDSWGEFFTGRAFRGGGQNFDITIAPGTETQTYSISLSDPYIFESEYTAGAVGAYTTRNYDEFDEKRLAASLSVGRRFGERWAGNLTGRYNNVNISSLRDNPATDFLDVRGDHDLTGLGARLTRTTVDTRFRPSRGTRIELGAERIGALGGDYDFTKLSARHQVFLTLDEDFLGRKTILSFRTDLNYIPEDVADTPLFERYYAGGRTFRGFKFRTISPKGVTAGGEQTSDPVGGTFSFLFSPEIEKPVFKDIISGVVFLDSGTVDNDFSLDRYRVSGGFGIRLYIEALGPVPLAFDFGFPIIKRRGDQERVFSFSIDLPF